MAININRCTGGASHVHTHTTGQYPWIWTIKCSRKKALRRQERQEECCVRGKVECWLGLAKTGKNWDWQNNGKVTHTENKHRNLLTIFLKLKFFLARGGKSCGLLCWWSSKTLTTFKPRKLNWVHSDRSLGEMRFLRSNETILCSSTLFNVAALARVPRRHRGRQREASLELAVLAGILTTPQPPSAEKLGDPSA